MPSLDPRDQLRIAVDELIRDGTLMVTKYMFRTATPEEAKYVADRLRSTDTSNASIPKGAAKKAAAKKAAPRKADTAKGVDDLMQEFRNFELGNEYQPWYSKALRTVEQLLPDRYDEFRSLYRVEKRKVLDIDTYGIYEAIHGIVVNHYGRTAFDGDRVALQKLQQQVAILESARPRLDFILADIAGVLEAGLFDHELAAAEELLKAGHLRAAGVVAGVVLERHLQHLIENHRISLRKKPTIANLNDALKQASVLDVPRWRQVQHLADVRNLCAHNGDRDPTPEEVESLVSGVRQVAKTVF